MKTSKLLKNFFDYNDFRAFKVFKWTAGLFFKYETTKIKLTENIKKGFWLKIFLYNAIFYQILMLFKFLKTFYVHLYCKHKLMCRNSKMCSFYNLEVS